MGNRRTGVWLVLLGLAACARGNLPAPAIAVTPLPSDARVGTDQAWHAARARHPLHFQGVFVAPVGGNRYRGVVVTEPPPHATPEGVKQALGAIGVESRDWTIGYDGWARDLVAVVDGDSRVEGQTKRAESSDADHFAALHQYLFHSMYRAAVFDPFAKPPPQPKELDLTLPVGALHEWVLAPSRTFQALNGAIITADEVQADVGHGVYRANDIGLSILILPKNTDLCLQRADLRNFALETDLFFGALATGNNIVLAGRERRIALDTLPPLRTETLLSLTTADPHQLAQSYQRNNLFAGKLRNGADWAPILLSPELIDTELGGLLNITDQLLKGWSLNGTVEYHNFPYYKPARWAAAQGLSDELGVQSLTFNWNTSGTVFEVDWRQARSLVSQRTGALPIAYIPEGAAMPGIADIEERNREFFASENDPNLVRVVAYTAFYHAAKRFGLSASSTCQTPKAVATNENKRSPGELFLEQEGRALLTGQSGSYVSTPKTSQQQERVAEMAQVFASVRQAWGEPGFDELVHYLAGVSGFPTVASPHQGVLDAAAKLAPQLHQTALMELVDRDGLFEEFKKRSQRPHEGYLGTPSLVVSRVPDKVSREQIDANHIRVTTVVQTGGHNLRLAPGRFTIESGRNDLTVQSERPFDFKLTAGEPLLRANPQAISRIQKQVQDRRIDVDTARKELELAARNSVALPKLDRAAAVPGMAGVGYDIPRRPPHGIAERAAVFSIRKEGQLEQLYAAVDPAGLAISAGSTSAIRQQLVNDFGTWFARHPKAPLLVELQDFPADQGQRFMANLVDHLNRDPKAPRVVYVLDKPGLAQRFREWLAAFRGSKNTTISEVASQVLPDGRSELSYRVEVQGGLSRLLVRVRDTFTVLRRTEFFENLSKVFRGSGDIVSGLDEFCAARRTRIEVHVETFGPLQPRDRVQLPGGHALPGSARVASNLNR